MAVLFERTDGQEATSIVYVSNFFNKIHYSNRTRELGFQDLHQETFEEAERILSEQNQIPLEPAAPL